jgi:hypothetical protein
VAIARPAEGSSPASIKKLEQAQLPRIREANTHSNVRGSVLADDPANGFAAMRIFAFLARQADDRRDGEIELQF